MATETATPRVRTDRSGTGRRTWSRYPRRTFYYFVAPWAVGFLLMTAVPLIYAFAVSLTNFDGISPRWRWVGMRNYTELFGDEIAWAALTRTIGYAAVAVPLTVAGSLALALLLNRRLKAVGLWRTIVYLPSIVPVVATAILWKLVFNRDAGIFNAALEFFGIDGVAWLIDPFAFYVLLILTLWGVGGGMVITLAALQDVPSELEDAARVDGAGYWTTVRHVTIPVISPVLYFQVVTGVIASLQIVIQPMLLAENNNLAGPGAVPDSTRLYMVQVWEEFFLNNRFGYGSAMLWIFFLIILAFTLLVQRSSRWWVHYEVDSDADK